MSRTASETIPLAVTQAALADEEAMETIAVQAMPRVAAVSEPSRDSQPPVASRTRPSRG